MFTYPNSFYSQLLHLHNDNLGDEIVIKARIEKRGSTPFSTSITRRRSEGPGDLAQPNTKSGGSTLALCRLGPAALLTLEG